MSRPLSAERAGALLLAVAALAACGPGASEAPSPRRQLVGDWTLVTVNGAALPTPSPEEPEYLIESVSMTLDEGGAYALTSSFRAAGQVSPQGVTIRGTWAASDDAITFEPEAGQGPAIVMFGYRMDGELLRMVDEEQNEWAMRRR